MSIGGGEGRLSQPGGGPLGLSPAWCLLHTGWNIQQIGTDCDAGGQQHGAPLDVVVAVQQADEGQVQEDASDHPEGDHRGQSPQSLCRGRQAIRDLPETLRGALRQAWRVTGSYRDLT